MSVWMGLRTGLDAKTEGKFFTHAMDRTPVFITPSPVDLKKVYVQTASTFSSNGKDLLIPMFWIPLPIRATLSVFHFILF